MRGVVNHFCLFLFFVVFSSFSLGQSVNDTLINKSYKELIDSFNNEGSFNLKEVFAKAVLSKARKKNDTSKIIVGHYLMSIYNTAEIDLNSIDSVIKYSKEKSNKYQPSISYFFKAEYYYRKRKFKLALDNYLNSLEYAKRHKNTKQIQKCNYYISLLKLRIGKPEEALVLLKENLNQTKLISKKTKKAI